MQFKVNIFALLSYDNKIIKHKKRETMIIYSSLISHGYDKQMLTKPFL